MEAPSGFEIGEDALAASATRADEPRRQGSQAGHGSIEAVEQYEIGMTVGRADGGLTRRAGAPAAPCASTAGKPGTNSNTWGASRVGSARVCSAGAHAPDSVARGSPCTRRVAAAP